MQGQALSLGEIMYPEHTNTDGFFETEEYSLYSSPIFPVSHLRVETSVLFLPLLSNTLPELTLLPTKPFFHPTQNTDLMLSEILWDAYETLKWMLGMSNAGASWMVLSVGIQGWSEKACWKVSAQAGFGLRSRSPSWEQVPLGTWYHVSQSPLRTKEYLLT